MKTKLIIVDISSFIFRAFFAIRPLHAHDGTPVNAVYGVMNMLMKMIANHQPTHIVMARDLSGPGFRHEIYEDYKANRSEAPEDLKPQFALIEELLDLMKLPEISAENYEADDIVGSLAVQYADKFDEVIIASGDKDLMQFVTDKVVMLDTMKNKKYDRDGVFEKMGVWPEQIVDYLSLVGDTSDNIPGVRGIGAKGAAKLLDQYQTLENVFDHISEITNKRVLNGLTEHRDDAILSKKLVQIVTDLELPHKPEDLVYKFHVDEDLIEFLKSLKFNSMIKKLQDLDEIDVKTSTAQSSQKQQVKIHALKTQKDIKEFAEKSDSLYAYYELRESESLNCLFLDNTKDKAKVLISSKLNTLSVLRAFNSYSGTIVADDIKSLMRAFTFHGEECEFEAFDLTLAAFNLRADMNNKFEALCSRYLEVDYEHPKLEEGLLQENEANEFEQKIAQRLDLTSQLHEVLVNELEEFETKTVYSDLDFPCVKTLVEMETEGIKLDQKFLSKLENDFASELEEIEAKIEKVSGESVNLRSPKQVGNLLFEVLEFPVIKKTKTGYSTNVDVLLELEKRVDSEIPSLILKYRELDKLLSTYVKALPTMVHPETKRIHTHFNLTVASTGRLSSDRPNLQNIPTRTENGKLIRKAFVADKGKVFVGADYSQVELRILAHYCGDETMLNAFKNNIDIHAQTASEIFEVPLDEMTSDIRSKAKAINFGLIYGQSSFGLSQALGISRKEAKEYIDHYFDRFSSVKDFLEGLKEDCRKTGYAKTLWGRKRVVADINSSNHAVKAMAERIAINSPIQGTAADIIKKAMVNVAERLEKEKLNAKLLLQVHDELIIECDEKEAEKVETVLCEEMLAAAELKVPLKVDLNKGKTWYELK